jgi:HSP20 family protein
MIEIDAVWLPIDRDHAAYRTRHGTPEEMSIMSTTRWDPWGEIVSLREAMNNLLEESFVRPRPGVTGPGMASSLALDVRETPEQFVITASVPGVPPSDIDISVLGDTLRIRGERKEETEETGDGHRWLLRERRFGAFERTVSLPTSVAADRAVADFKDGVLTVTLPKAEAAKAQTIPVKGTAPAAAQVDIGKSVAESKPAQGLASGE